VNINNIGIDTFPDLVVARLFGFGARDLLEFEAAEIEDVDVKQLFGT
jgi:LemA protein